MPNLLKANLLTGVIATHFAGLMLLLHESNNHWQTGGYGGLPVRTFFLVFFFLDLAPLLMFLFLRPDVEGGVRVIGLFWTLQRIAILLPAGIGPVFLLVCCIEIVLLVWPKRYLQSNEDEIEIIEERVEKTARAKCASCGAMYTYRLDLVTDGEVVCQNCGKPFRI